MKLVVAAIRPFKLEPCLRALAQAGFEAHSSEARGYGRQKDHLQAYRDSSYAVSFLPKARVEFAVESNDLRRAIELVCSVCRTGRQGDGKIWVLEARAAAPQAAGA